MNRGGSLSGRERHCVFLNMGATSGGAPQFANQSAGSGLDLSDDGRAIALSDWDGDGDVDMWISNRNAPRLRFMRNDSPAENHFVSLQLIANGTTTNRDAIGARVEVVTSEGRSIKTLRAGEGYLAQSGKELQVGLGGASEIERLIVRWPDRMGTVEEFSGLAVDQRYEIKQGEGKVRPLGTTRSELVLKPSPPVLPAPRETARIPLVTLLPLPNFTFTGKSGESVRLGAGKPVLLNLWASWCTPCLVELAEIRDREAEIRAAGIDVVALSVDGLDESADPAALGAAIAKLRFPFVMTEADADVVGLLQWHHDASVGLDRSLPVPSSFLIDGRGRVSVIYKGPVSFNDLLRDGFLHSQGTRAERWKGSAQIPGRTIEDRVVVDAADEFEASAHFQHGVHRESLGDLDRAMGHYREALRIRPAFALAHRNAGRLHAQRGAWRAATPHFAGYVEARPQDPAGHHALGLAHQHLGNLAEARSQFEATIALQEGHVPALDALGELQLLAGQRVEAMASFRAVLKLAPAHASAMNNLAWILATHPDDQLRDAAESLRLATKLVDLDGGKKAEYLDTLAVAQAASGQFEEAAATARRGVSLAQTEGQNELASQIQNKIALYARGEAFRDRK